MTRFILLLTSIFFAACAFNSDASAASDIPSAITNGTVTGELKAYSYSYDQKGNNNDANDNAYGGIVAFRTDPLAGFSLGVTTAAAGNLFSNTSEESYGILNDNGGRHHIGYFKWNEYYARYEFDDSVIKYGAQQIDAPFLSQDYSMMFPRTYKGLTVLNSGLEHFNFGFFYVTDFSNYTDNHFENIISRVDKVNDNRPLVAGMVKYNTALPFGDVLVTHWNYHMDDVFNSQYIRANVHTRLNDMDYYIKPTYIKQNSIGDNLGGSFKTFQYGAETGVTRNSTKYKLYYAQTGRDKLFSPWDFGEVVVQQYLYSHRANEKVYAVDISHDFNDGLLKGLTLEVSAGLYDTPEIEQSTAVDANEIDYSAAYQFNDSGFFGGLRTDIGYTTVNYSDDRYIREYSIRNVYNFKGSLSGLRFVLKDTYYDYKISDDLNDLQLRLIYSFTLNSRKI